MGALHVHVLVFCFVPLLPPSLLGALKYRMTNFWLRLTQVIPVLAYRPLNKCVCVTAWHELVKNQIMKLA